MTVVPPDRDVAGTEIPVDGHEYRPGDRDYDKALLQDGFKGHLECWGYKSTIMRTILYHFLGVISVGLGYVILSWHPTWSNAVKRIRCDLKDATAVLLKDSDGDYFVYVIVTRVLAVDPKFVDDRVKDFCIVKQRLSEKTMKEKSKSSAKNLGAELLQHRSLSEASSPKELKISELPSGSLTKEFSIRTFDHQYVRYVWEPAVESFKLLTGVPRELTCGDLLSRESGVSSTERQQRLSFFGPNLIDIEVKSIPRLLFEEVLNPFYCFQGFCIILWSLDDYYIYASCVLVVSLFGISISLYETRKQRLRMREMVLKSSTSEPFLVMGENGEFVDCDPKNIVPGDLIVIPPNGCRMPCDAILIEGNCIVNEGVLTGESAPITKVALNANESDEFKNEEHKRHILFHGTTVIQTRYYGGANVLAVVLQTGFYTIKGDLVRSILFPKPVGFKFYRDALRLLGVMAGISVCGMAYSMYVYAQREEEIGLMIKRALDLITIVVPPALPAALTVGIVYSQRRLKKLDIFCISPSRINVCGKVKLVCFDKTGTLTQEGLDLMGVIPVKDGLLDDMVSDVTRLDTTSSIVHGMASCHSLTFIKGQLSGDPLDVKLFEATQWLIQEPMRSDKNEAYNSLIATSVCPPNAKPEVSMLSGAGDASSAVDSDHLGIVKQFPFSSALQRMSVVTRSPREDHFTVYAKGSPEKINSLCLPRTVPNNFHKVLHFYAQQGFRVIALASRDLDPKIAWHHIARLKRESVECELSFVGLMIMRNSLKPETAGVIATLNLADIRSVMVTGDNLMTAVSVARECGMVMKDEDIVVVDVMPPDELTSSAAHIIWRYSDSALSSSDTSIAERDDDSESSTPSRAASANEFRVTMERSKFHFALSGRSFSALLAHFPEMVPEILVRSTIFARMSPDEKTDLVEKFIDLEYITAMVGDGANDCGALKAAHAGISLSEAEASVASPFTSRKNTIECVPIVIREGRCALTTSFGVFKYMALYSIVQFIAVLILYQKRTILLDPHFLYLDMAITTTVAVLMGYTQPADRLHPKRPSASLIAPVTIASVFIHMIIVVCFQSFVILYLVNQPWFGEGSHITNDEKQPSMESSMLFFTAAFQDLILAFVFSSGPPYRKRIWTNAYFMSAMVVLLALTVFLLMYVPEWLYFMKVYFDPTEPRYLFRATILGIMAANFVVCVVMEEVVKSPQFKKLINRIRRKTFSKSKFKVVSREVDMKADWPPVGETTYAKVVDESSSESSKGSRCSISVRSFRSEPDPHTTSF